MRTHDERVLVAGLGGLNADLARFVMGALEADWSGADWPHSPHAEAELALRMVQLAGQLEIHARTLASSARAISGDAANEPHARSSAQPS